MRGTYANDVATELVNKWRRDFGVIRSEVLIEDIEREINLVLDRNQQMRFLWER